MASSLLKKCVALVATGIILLVAYFGNYLPLRKSQAFISVLRNTGNLRTVQEFLDAYTAVFALPSPIGQEELVRNFAGTVVNIIGSYPNPEVVPPLIQLTTDAYAPILRAGRGMSYPQNLYVLGNLHQAAFIRTHDPRYLDGARDYYRDGMNRAPRRPQFLYGLLDVYRLQGNTQGVLEMRDAILALWPQDTRVAEAVQAYLSLVGAQGTSTPPKPAP